MTWQIKRKIWPGNERRKRKEKKRSEREMRQSWAQAGAGNRDGPQGRAALTWGRPGRPSPSGSLKLTDNRSKDTCPCALNQKF